MEDGAVKAIVIGVSIFVTMAVVSALMIYFNTAKGVADAVNLRTDIAEVYDKVMNNDINSDILTGVEVRSLINKYVGNSSVRINIQSISGENEAHSNINNSWCGTNGVIKEQYLDLINPVWNCKVTKNVSGTNVTLLLDLDVDLDNTEEE